MEIQISNPVVMASQNNYALSWLYIEYSDFLVSGSRCYEISDILYFLLFSLLLFSGIYLDGIIRILFYFLLFLFFKLIFDYLSS